MPEFWAERKVCHVIVMMMTAVLFDACILPSLLWKKWSLQWNKMKSKFLSLSPRPRVPLNSLRVTWWWLLKKRFCEYIQVKYVFKISKAQLKYNIVPNSVKVFYFSNCQDDCIKSEHFFFQTLVKITQYFNFELSEKPPNSHFHFTLHKIKGIISF